LKPFDINGDFHPVAGGGELRRLAVRGAGATVLSSAGALAVQMIATVVLARLLTPADFGVVAMVTTFSLLLLNFGLNGFTEAILQWDQLTHGLASNLFWINLGCGAALTLGFAAAGSLMARFYGDARVTHVAAGVSLAIFLTSTSVLHLALLKRAMRFSAASVNDIVSRAASVVVSIALAWAGWGYWALVAGVVAQPLSQSVGAWFLCRWLPGLPRRVSGTGSMVRFALHIYGRFTVNYCARNMDNLLVGWRFGPGALGFYKKAYDLFLLSATQLVSPLTNVAVSALSRLHRDSAQYRKYLLSSLAVIAFVGMGVGADLTLVGKDVIRLLLGPGWDPAGRIFMFFGPGVGIMLLYYTHGWIHLSIGTADRWFRWVFVEFAVTGLLFLLGLRWGPEGIAVAWTLSFCILVVPAFWYAGRPIHFGVGPVVAAVWKYVLASLLAGGGAAAIIRSLWTLAEAPTTFTAFTHIVMDSAIFVTLYIAIVVLLHRSFAPLNQLLRLARQMAPLGKFAGAPSETTPAAVPGAAGLPEQALVPSDSGGS
jgi:O-antigen/teichoic acid export membrane protein